MFGTHDLLLFILSGLLLNIPPGPARRHRALFRFCVLLGFVLLMLASYSSYYNESRTHLALEKDAPLRRAIQRCGAIITTPILSGLHHRYARI